MPQASKVFFILAQVIGNLWRFLVNKLCSNSIFLTKMQSVYSWSWTKVLNAFPSSQNLFKASFIHILYPAYMFTCYLFSGTLLHYPCALPAPIFISGIRGPLTKTLLDSTTNALKSPKGTFNWLDLTGKQSTVMDKHSHILNNTGDLWSVRDDLATK